MTKTIYHSALKGVAETFSDVIPMDKAQHGDCLVMRADISNGLPLEFMACDFIYGEPPFPHGAKIFDERAGVSGRKYADLAKAVRRVVERSRVPVFLIVGKTMLKHLPDPSGYGTVDLNGNKEILAWWRTEYEGPLTTNLEVTNYLGSVYDIMGDFCCGYGEPLFSFLRGGGLSFVGSDYDGRCVSVMDRRMKEILG